MRTRMRSRHLLLNLLCCVFFAVAPGPASAQQMKIVETDKLRLVYFNPGADYLVPYAAQAFTNSLAAQQAHFGYVPDGKVSILLQDFSDRGNAIMQPSPRNRLYFDISPV